MSWREKVKKFIDGLIKISVEIDLRKFVNIEVKNYHITSSKENPPLELADDKSTLRINLEKVDEEQRKTLQSAIRNAVEQEDYLLIEKSSVEILSDFKEIDSSEEVKKIIEPLKDFIPPQDLQALRASMYLRKRFQGKESIQNLKNDIVVKFGDRGRRIANLCTAGYFEKTIIPLLEEMKTDSGFSKEKFQPIYETIIAESGFAVFVSARMTGEQVVSSIREKIKANIKYGLKHINIHGIGQMNVKKIRETVEELLSKLRGLEKTIENKIGNTIYVRLEFQPDLGKALPEI